MKLFGTDGVRGQVNVFPMTIENVLHIGQALGLYLSGQNSKKVIIGKDTRLSGYMFETALASGLVSAGLDVYMLGPLPTPGISFLTESMRAVAGVMITASHNPYQDNGIKIFGHDGFKLSDAAEKEIEAMVADPSIIASKLSADCVGKAFRLDDAQGRYVSHLKSSFPKAYNLNKFKVVLDCANGAAYKIAPAVFKELGSECVVINSEPSGVNINEACGAVHPEHMQQEVLKHKANFGVSFDGDADRLVMSDEKGTLLNGDDLLYLIIQSMIKRGKKPKGVVGTLMTNMALEVFCQQQGIDFVRASVGDRFVVQEMKKKQYLLGGEPSGHLIYLPNCNSGDGVLNALFVAAVLCEQRKPLSEIAEAFQQYPQKLKNIDVKEKKPLDQCPLLSSAILESQKRLKNKGRVLVRYSGTENKLRLMVEADEMDKVHFELDALMQVAQEELA